MKKFLIFTVALTLCAFTAAPGDELGDDLTGVVEITALGGLGIPVGDLADNNLDTNDKSAFRKVGYDIDAVLNYYVSSNIGLGISYSACAFGSRTVKLDNQNVESGSEMRASLLGLQVKIVPSNDATLQPYGLVAGGLMFSKIHDLEPRFTSASTTADYEVDSSPYMMVGGGLSYPLTDKVSFALEGTFGLAFSDGSEVKLNDVAQKDMEIQSDYSFFGIGAGFQVQLGSLQ